MKNTQSITDEDLIENLLNFGLTATIEKYKIDKQTAMDKLKLHMPHMFPYCMCRANQGLCMVACCDAYGLDFKYSQILK